MHASGTWSIAMKRTLRHAGTGAAALALLHAALVALFPGDRNHLGLLETAHAFSKIHGIAPLALMAPTLLWLAHRQPAAYARAAIALLLSVTAGLVFAKSAAMRGLPSPEGSVVHDYVALPGALTGWYLLMALALAAALSAVRAGIAVLVVAVSAVATSVLTADDPVYGAVWAAGVPLVAWYAAGRVQRPRTRGRGGADAWEPEGRVVPFPHGDRVTRQRPATASVSLRKTG
ncbi:hypothetical protein [Streptomyces olivochromogenes]|uniref:hypothetical protein n=1 Tax=Streptomyces olivochromogenes TaxID=1963 RepID=UPI001F1EA48D|nr:hypothetical protein [Streptomyces olivochromogenes]MCF3130456.1 hypothetical protein [Streptomyces olivochromogenes]